MSNLSEIIKNVLYIASILSGSILMISLLITASIRLICIAIDNLKIGNVIKECLKIYLKEKRPDLNIKTEDIDFTKGRVKK